MTDQRWQPRDLESVAELIKDIDICMLVTRSNGSLRGRPMSNNGKVEFDGDSWFFSYRDTAKVREIEADPTVELAHVATEKGAWVSIEGRAQLVDDADRKRELWEKSLEQWFPEGPDDEALTLVKVEAQRIHTWAEGEEQVLEPRA